MSTRHGAARPAAGEVRIGWLVPHIERYMAKHDLSREEFAIEAGLDWTQVYRLVSGEQKFMKFDTADRLVCNVLGDAHLWHDDPEGFRAYMEVDLRYVDESDDPDFMSPERVAERKRLSDRERRARLKGIIL